MCSSPDPRDKRLRTSAILRQNGRTFAIDAGPDFREQMLRAGVQELDGVLITHEHYDHTSGLDDLRPFCFSQGIDMPVYCLPRVAADLRKRYHYAFSGYPGVPRLDIREVGFGDRIPFAGGEVELLEVLHGRISIFGFRWYELAYLTDVKELPDETRRRCSGCRHVIISSLHHTGTHSHLSLRESLAYLEQLEAKHGVLFHFSHRMGRTGELNPQLPPGVECGFDGMQLLAQK